MKTFSEVIVNGETAVLHLLEDNTVIGSVTYNQKDKALYNLLVDIKHRHVGNGEMLLKEAIFRYHPVHITASTCYGCNIGDVVKLYEKVGFKVDNVHMIYEV